MLLTGIWYLRGVRQEEAQKRRFYDVCNYLDSMLAAFSRGGKIEEALLATEEVMAEGSMKEVLRRTITRMAVGGADEKMYEDCFSLIEQEFACEQIRKNHGFMIHAEYFGGETSGPIALLQLDRKNWQQRCQANMEERKRAFRNIVLSVIMAIIICGMILYLPTASVDISSHMAVQIVGVITVALDCVILLRGQRYLCADWICLGEEKDGADAVQKMEAYQKGQASGKHIARNCLTVLSVVLAVLAVAFRHLWMGFGWIAIALVCYNWETFVWNTRKKQITRLLQRAFPRWLLDIVLLLQSENVQMALQRSMEQAPQILRAELRKLLHGIDLEPESYRPYHEFLKDFDIPEIHSSMRGLYAISMGNDDRQGEQLQELVAGNHELLNLAERERQKDANSGMYLLFLAPVLTASGKMIVDMTVFMLTFLSGAMIG